MNVLSGIAGAARRVAASIIQPASAHCDTEDGPAVVDGRRALETGNANLALKWVHAEAEGEVRDVFDKAIRVRAAGGEARELADRLFLETLVRVHRAGEGAGFDGIKPTGTQLPETVVAADEAIAAGTIEPLRGLIDDERWAELERRFDHAMSLKDFDEGDLDAAREYIGAYVSFFKYAEGDEHDHVHHHAHAH